jgi:hypothetical protein
MLKRPSQHYLDSLLTISTFLLSDSNPVQGLADNPYLLPREGLSPDEGMAFREGSGLAISSNSNHPQSFSKGDPPLPTRTGKRP